MDFVSVYFVAFRLTTPYNLAHYCYWSCPMGNAKWFIDSSPLSVHRRMGLPNTWHLDHLTFRLLRLSDIALDIIIAWICLRICSRLVFWSTLALEVSCFRWPILCVSGYGRHISLAEVDDLLACSTVDFSTFFDRYLPNIEN